jgi:YidC/Oxa1 family membrane protein insertase
MTENTKNMLIAAALSLIFIGLWDYFYAFPELDRQKQAQTQKIKKLKVDES